MHNILSGCEGRAPVLTVTLLVVASSLLSRLGLSQYVWYFAASVPTLIQHSTHCVPCGGHTLPVAGYLQTLWGIVYQWSVWIWHLFSRNHWIPQS